MSTFSNDRSLLCAFTFVDGRRCRMPRRDPHPYLCPFHARKEAQALAGQRAAQDIAYYFSGAYHSACDLNSALGRLFVAVANGEIKPKAAATLAYLGQTMACNLRLAQDEYINAHGTDFWRETIFDTYNQNVDRLNSRQATSQPSTPRPPADPIDDPNNDSNNDPNNDPDNNPMDTEAGTSDAQPFTSADPEPSPAPDSVAPDSAPSDPKAASDLAETEKELTPVE